MHADRYRFIRNFEVAVPVAQMHIKLPKKIANHHLPGAQMWTVSFLVCGCD